MADYERQLSSHPMFVQPPPGYRRSKSKLDRLERFKNLIIHRERWAGDVDAAPPVETLFADEEIDRNSFRTVQRIEEEIKQNAPLVFWDLQWAGVPTAVDHRERDPVTGNVTVTKYDAITDYFRLPRHGDGQAAYEATMDVLHQGIGVYKAMAKQAKRNRWNPVVWLAHFIRLPITVMEYAGLTAHPKAQEMLVGAYAWFMRIAMLALILSVSIHYGVKIPWNELFSGVVKTLFK
jgi:hypothetical protein